MTKGHLDKDVVRQLFFFLVVREINYSTYSPNTVFQLPGLFPYGHPVRSLPHGKRSARHRRVFRHLRITRGCSRQDHQDVYLE